MQSSVSELQEIEDGGKPGIVLRGKLELLTRDELCVS